MSDNMTGRHLQHLEAELARRDQWVEEWKWKAGERAIEIYNLEAQRDVLLDLVCELKERIWNINGIYSIGLTRDLRDRLIDLASTKEETHG